MEAGTIIAAYDCSACLPEACAAVTSDCVGCWGAREPGVEEGAIAHVPSTQDLLAQVPVDPRHRHPGLAPARQQHQTGMCCKWAVIRTVHCHRCHCLWHLYRGVAEVLGVYFAEAHTG